MTPRLHAELRLTMPRLHAELRCGFKAPTLQLQKNPNLHQTLTSQWIKDGKITAGTDRDGTYLVKFVHVVGQQIDYLARGCLPHGRVT